MRSSVGRPHRRERGLPCRRERHGVARRRCRSGTPGRWRRTGTGSRRVPPCRWPSGRSRPRPGAPPSGTRDRSRPAAGTVCVFRTFWPLMSCSRAVTPPAAGRELHRRAGRPWSCRSRSSPTSLGPPTPPGSGGGEVAQHLEAVGVVEVAPDDRAHRVESRAGEHHQARAVHGVVHADADRLVDRGWCPARPAARRRERAAE